MLYQLVHLFPGSSAGSLRSEVPFGSRRPDWSPLAGRTDNALPTRKAPRSDLARWALTMNGVWGVLEAADLIGFTRCDLEAGIRFRPFDDHHHGDDGHQHGWEVAEHFRVLGLIPATSTRDEQSSEKLKMRRVLISEVGLTSCLR